MVTAQDRPPYFEIRQTKYLKDTLLAGQVIILMNENDVTGEQGRAVFHNSALFYTLQPGTRIRVNWNDGSIETSPSKTGGHFYKIMKWTVVDKPQQTANNDPWSMPQQNMQQQQQNMQQQQQNMQQQQQNMQQNNQSVNGSYGPDRSRPAGLSDPSNQQQRNSIPYDPQASNQPQTIPIASLNPYNTRFSIKARCSQVGDVRKWSNQKGEGQLMKVIFSDKSGEIPATIFGQAVDKYKAMLKEGAIYHISKVKIKTQNERFKTTNHLCELNIDDNSIVDFVGDDDKTIPKVIVNFSKISSIEEKVKGDTVDVLGVLIGASEMQSINIKSTGQTKQKRDITILDDSQTAISVCLWGNDVNIITEDLIESAKSSYSRGEMPTVILIKEARVDEFNGKNLTKSFNSKVLINPEIEECQALRQWFMSQYRGNESNAKSLSGSGGGLSTPWMTIVELNNLAVDSVHQEALDGKGVWFNLRAVIKQINMDGKYYWESCTTCGKKVQDGSGDTYSMDNGSKFCAHCNRNVDSTKKWVCRMEVLDVTGLLKLTAMGDKANSVLKILCDDAYLLSLQEENEDSFGRNHEDIKFGSTGKTFIFKCVARNRVWQDQKQVDFQVAEATEISDIKETIKEANRVIKALSEN